eukprot:193923_1
MNGLKVIGGIIHSLCILSIILIAIKHWIHLIRNINNKNKNTLFGPSYNLFILAIIDALGLTITILGLFDVIFYNEVSSALNTGTFQIRLSIRLFCTGVMITCIYGLFTIRTIMCFKYTVYKTSRMQNIRIIFPLIVCIVANIAVIVLMIIFGHKEQFIFVPTILVLISYYIGSVSLLLIFIRKLKLSVTTLNIKKECSVVTVTTDTAPSVKTIVQNPQNDNLGYLIIKLIILVLSCVVTTFIQSSSGLIILLLVSKKHYGYVIEIVVIYASIVHVVQVFATHFTFRFASKDYQIVCDPLHHLCKTVCCR